MEHSVSLVKGKITYLHCTIYTKTITVSFGVGTRPLQQIRQYMYNENVKFHTITTS